MIMDINVVPLYVTDQQRTMDFFMHRLGFEQRIAVEVPPGRWWYEIAVPGSHSAIAVLRAADYSRSPTPGLTMTLCCDDVRATVEQLRRAGVEVTDPVDRPWGTFAELTDPDGHLFVLGERPAR